MIEKGQLENNFDLTSRYAEMLKEFNRITEIISKIFETIKRLS